MSYLDTQLQPGETIVYRTRQHWSVFFKPVLLSLVALMFAGMDNASLNQAASLFLVFFVLPYTLAVGMAYLVSDLMVTDRRFIARLGVRRITITESVLHKIESVDRDPGLLGRVLGYGNVTLNVAGGLRRRVNNVRAAIAFVEALENAIAQSRSEDA